MLMMMMLLRTLYAMLLLRIRNLNTPGSLFLFTIVVDWQFCLAIYHAMIWLFYCNWPFPLGVCTEAIFNALRVGSMLIYFVLLPKDVAIGAYSS